MISLLNGIKSFAEWDKAMIHNFIDRINPKHG